MGWDGKGGELLTLEFDVDEMVVVVVVAVEVEVFSSLTVEGDLIPFDAIIDNFGLHPTTICRARGFVSHTNREHLFIHFIHPSDACYSFFINWILFCFVSTWYCGKSKFSIIKHASHNK